VWRIRDIRLVKFLSNYLKQLWRKKKKVHLFLLILLLVIVIGMVIGGVAKFVPAITLIYLEAVSCIYTGRWICRKWVLTKRWLGLFGVLIAALVGYDVAGLLISVYLLDSRISTNHILESSINIMAFVLLLIFGGFFISVIRSAIREKMNGLILAEQKKASELSLLQSQVSPHFLFNTLNNMYSLSINRPAEMPDLLLKLSGLLRYSVYEASQPLVLLQEELKYIRNYIDLESIRTWDRLALAVKMDIDPTGIRIVPMILIVFVENAFKHARNTLERHITISIDAKVEESAIFFNVMNSCAEEKQESLGDKRHSGFGIDNVIKRLDLLYPGEYSLKWDKQPDYFNVELRLTTR
jgi:sensor histidine kinase YesM